MAAKAEKEEKVAELVAVRAVQTAVVRAMAVRGGLLAVQTVAARAVQTVAPREGRAVMERERRSASVAEKAETVERVAGPVEQEASKHGCRRTHAQSSSSHLYRWKRRWSRRCSPAAGRRAAASSP